MRRASDAGGRLSFEDTNLSDRIGWREITLNGDGTTLSDSEAATNSVSDRLLAYPTRRWIAAAPGEYFG